MLEEGEGLVSGKNLGEADENEGQEEEEAARKDEAGRDNQSVTSQCSGDQEANELNGNSEKQQEILLKKGEKLVHE